MEPMAPQLIDLYELSPMQQGMLFHSLYAPNAGLYFEQRSCRIQGVLDVARFQWAWQQTIDRHPILRSAFYWEELEKPLQAVFQQADLPWIVQDWRHFSAIEQDEKLDAFLLADRQQGFELAQAPLMRCALMQLQDDSYAFIWSHHHLLMDGWCNAILLQEVLRFYDAACRGESLVLPPARPYRDYIVWLQQQDLTQAEQFWRRTLQGVTAPTPLGIDGRQDQSSDHADTCDAQMQLSVETTAALQAIAQRYHLTLNTIVQGAWAILLSCYSGESDVILGATVSGRPADLIGVESIIGLFINTLPVRVHYFSDVELISWLQQLQIQQVEREQYGYSSLIDIQSWSDVPRGTPLFESLVIFENYPISIETALQPWNHRFQIHQTQGFERTNYPLTLTTIPSQQISFRLSYQTHRFAPTTIRQVLGHLQTLLETIATQPNQQLVNLPILSVQEQQQLQAWQTHPHQPIVPETSLACVHTWFETQAEQTPDAIAVVFEEAQLTYRELNQRANQLAHHLQATGISAASLVGIRLDRSIEMVIALLGILKAGAAYVPIDPSYPPERIRFMLEDAQVSVLITGVGEWMSGWVKQMTPSLPHSLTPSLSHPTINLSTNWHAITQYSTDNPTPLVPLDQRAYVLYTSGSTGKPKGVQISHRALANFLASMRQTPGLSGSDRLLAVTTLSFDIAALELFLPLIVGARLVIASRDVASDGTPLAEQLVRQQITAMQATPATWRLLLAAGWQGDRSLRIFCGGEALDTVLANQLLPRSQTLWNLYGPTETTIWSTCYPVQSTQNSKLKTQNSSIPIGRPIANTQLYVLDTDLHLVPPGLPGELHIGGAGLAWGYLHRPDLTAEKFIPNSFGAGRLYKTGDRVRYRPDGVLEYLGRLDSQIKLQGFRIELGEIEATLNHHPQVEQSVVLLQSDTTNPRLVAYFVPVQQQAQTADSGNPQPQATSPTPHLPTPSHLRQFLSDRLPAYMVPKVFLALDAFPLTPNGKIDRVSFAKQYHHQLSLPDAGLVDSDPSSPPQTPTQQVVVALVAMVLDLPSDQIHLNDNFFDLGGHSLTATRLISQIRQAFRVELPLRTLFEQPAIADFTSAIELAIQTQFHANPAIPPLHPAPYQSYYPLSFAQQRQWVLAQLEPDSPSYNIPTAVRIKGELSIATLQRSLNQILHRHGALRTAFELVNGQPVQRILSDLCLDLPVIDLSGLPPAMQESQVQHLAVREARQPFALNCPPLLRVKVLRLQASEHVLFLTLHHSVADGWSMGVLVEELAALYSAIQHHQPNPLADLPIQYVDFAVWQRQWLQGEVLETQLNYWKAQLQGASVLELPTDYPRPAVRSVRGASQPVQLSVELTEVLKQLSQRSGCTLFMTLLAAFNLLLYRYTGNEDIVVGTPIANRNRTEIERLIGFFVNTLALRTDLSGNPSFTELLQRVRNVTLDGYAHQDLPFEQLVEELQLQRSLNVTPLFQVMFVLQTLPMQSLTSEGLCWSPLNSHSGTAKFDLTLSLHETTDGLAGTLEYSLDLFTASTIERMIAHWQVLLEAIVAHPKQPISAFPILTPAEQQQILINWNQTQTPYPRSACIHHLFEQQAEITPDRVAIVCGEQQFTYQELNCCANQLAHDLHNQGIKPETAIGICISRSPEFIIGILGILKAGGIYVPLDPSYPQERLAFMLEDAQAEMVITCSTDAPKLSFSHLPIIDLDRNWTIIASFPIKNPNLPLSAENLAYVIYTSGSTGVPKGVCVPHRGVVRLVQQNGYADLNANEVLLHAAPVTFDASIFEIWGALLNGGKLALVSTSQPSLTELGDAIERHQVTTLWLTAGLFHLMVDEQPHRFRQVRQLLAGGDVLSGQHIQKLQQAHPTCQIINGYGPTESTTFACCYAVPPEPFTSASPPIGYPIANTQIYVLDRHLQPVPVGVPGELYLAGDGLARGYLNRPDLTAEKFIPNPFLGNGEWGIENRDVSTPHSLLPIPYPLTLYQTGDRVRYHPNGFLEYLGRLDNQVKIRGFRVELSEIEAVLSRHPVVRDAIVVAHTGESDQKRLVAYVVANQENQNPDSDLVSKLRHCLREQLPDYLIPSRFILLDELPLTANGKVNRSVLPMPEPAQLESRQAIVTSRSPLEAKLVAIWTDVLKLDSVSIHDNFFEMGGDSILAIQIVSRANQAGLPLTPKQLFQHQTIAELAATVAPLPPLPAAEQETITGIVPLTPIQHWFFEQNLPNPDHFNQALLLTVHSPLNLVWLEQSLIYLLHHHDGLRSRFESTEIGWQQIVAPPRTTAPLTCFDLSSLPAAVQTETIGGIANQIHQSLQLDCDPLMRVVWFNLGEDQPHRLLFVIHHLIIDGISWRILLEDLQTVYQQISQGQSVQLPAKTTSLKHWAESLQNWAAELQPDWSDWVKLQRDHPALPVDRSGVNTITTSEHVTISLTVEQTQALLRDVPNAYQTQINDVLLTALVQTFAEWTGDPSLRIDLEGHGRTDLWDSINLSRTIGWFTTITPVILELGNAQTAGDALKQIKEQLRQIPHQGLSYGVLRYLTSSSTTEMLKNLASAEVCFNYLGQFDQLMTESSIFQLAPESSGSTQSSDAPRPYQIEINGLIVEKQLQLNWTYSRERYERSTITNLAQQFVNHLLHLIEHCISPEAGGYTPSDFSLVQLNQAELDAVLSGVAFEGGEV